tara:strand:+ start:762 stop:1085 length:324 start_codon:yes stop_codon:yes gene_type:complete
MKADEAIEKLKQKQMEMMRQAEAMTWRADKLKAIAECQEDGYRWSISEIEFTDCLMKVKHLRLFCTKTEVSFEVTPINDGFPMLMLDNDNMSLKEYINDGEVGDDEE